MYQRLSDWRRERQIKRYSRDMLVAWNAGNKIEARRLDRLRITQINARSPSQVERMESRMDFNVRRTVKRLLMGSFVSGRMPSTIVAAVFRLLRLRSL